jgi:predicted transcriptional regulator
MSYSTQHKKFEFVLKTCVLLTLLVLVGLFYFLPNFDFLSSKSKTIPFIKFIITEIPKTHQASMDRASQNDIPINIQTAQDEISSSQEETQIDSVYIISFLQFSDSIKIRYFDSDLLGKKIEKDQIVSYEHYKQMIENMRPKLNNKQSPYEIPDNIQAEYNRKMGRDAQYLMLPQINLGEVFSKITDSQGTKEISLEGILFCEKYLDILDTLWIKNPLKVTEIYHKKRVRKKNSIITLQNTLNALIEKGLVESDENSYGEIEYRPAINIKKMLVIINDFVARTSQQKGAVYQRLISIQNHVILNHEIY